MGRLQDWVDRAALDIENAHGLFGTEPTPYDNVVFLAQQAVEKIIKTFLVRHQVRFPKIHSIDVLLDQYVASADPDLAEAAEPAVMLTDYAVLVRYPPQPGHVDRSTAAHALQVMDQMWELFEPRAADRTETQNEEKESEEERGPDRRG